MTPLVSALEMAWNCELMSPSQQASIQMAFSLNKLDAVTFSFALHLSLSVLNHQHETCGIFQMTQNESFVAYLLPL